MNNYVQENQLITLINTRSGTKVSTLNPYANEFKPLQYSSVPNIMESMNTEPDEVNAVRYPVPVPIQLPFPYKSPFPHYHNYERKTTNKAKATAAPMTLKQQMQQELQQKQLELQLQQQQQQNLQLHQSLPATAPQIPTAMNMLCMDRVQWPHQIPVGQFTPLPNNMQMHMQNAYLMPTTAQPSQQPQLQPMFLNHNQTPPQKQYPQWQQYELLNDMTLKIDEEPMTLIYANKNAIDSEEDESNIKSTRSAQDQTERSGKRAHPRSFWRKRSPAAAKSTDNLGRGRQVKPGIEPTVNSINNAHEISASADHDESPSAQQNQEAELEIRRSNDKVPAETPVPNADVVTTAAEQPQQNIIDSKTASYNEVIDEKRGKDQTVVTTAVPMPTVGTINVADNVLSKLTEEPSIFTSENADCAMADAEDLEKHWPKLGQIKQKTSKQRIAAQETDSQESFHINFPQIENVAVNPLKVQLAEVLSESTATKVLPPQALQAWTSQQLRKLMQNDQQTTHPQTKIENNELTEIFTAMSEYDFSLPINKLSPSQTKIKPNCIMERVRFFGKAPPSTPIQISSEMSINSENVTISLDKKLGKQQKKARQEQQPQQQQQQPQRNANKTKASNANQTKSLADAASSCSDASNVSRSTISSRAKRISESIFNFSASLRSKVSSKQPDDKRKPILAKNNSMKLSPRNTSSYKSRSKSPPNRNTIRGSTATATAAETRPTVVKAQGDMAPIATNSVAVQMPEKPNRLKDINRGKQSAKQQLNRTELVRKS